MCTVFPPSAYPCEILGLKCLLPLFNYMYYFYVLLFKMLAMNLLWQYFGFTSLHIKQIRLDSASLIRQPIPSLKCSTFDVGNLRTSARTSILCSFRVLEFPLLSGCHAQWSISYNAFPFITLLLFSESSYICKPQLCFRSSNALSGNFFGTLLRLT